MSPLTYTPNPPPHQGPSPHQGPGSSVPPAPGPPDSNRARTLWLAIGIPVGVLVLLALIAAAVFAWFSLAPANTVDTNATLADAQSVSVDVSNAKLNLLPSGDDQVHVAMTGTYTGPAPVFTAQVDGAVAEIKADCPRVWLFTPPCNLTVTIELPANLDVAVEGVNGRVTLADLAGNVQVETVNGDIEATGMSGPLDLVNVNGQITVQDASSDTVTAETVNGSIDVDLTTPPSAVTATTVNGAITVHVPDDGTAYAVTTDTVLGKVDTGKIPTDPAAAHTIDAETVNGSITLAAVGR